MKKIAILGASYLQLPLINKANAMGLETHCFAWDNDEAVCKDIAHFFYPISVLDKELILEKCEEIKIDGITTIATDICIPTIAFVSDKMNLISNGFKSSILSTNKSKMRRAFDLNHINSPKSETIDNYRVEDFENYVFPLIVKPTDRSGSRGVTKVRDKIELEKAIQNGLKESFEKKVVVEEFIDGVEVSVESITWKGEHHILTITDKVTTNEPYFVEIEHHQPSLLSKDIQNNIKKETIKALNALNIKFGAGHSEFKIDSTGKAFIIEVGARMGGDFIGSHLVELSTGYDYVQAVIEIALGKFTSIGNLYQNFSGIYFLSKETEYLLPYFDSKNDFDIEKKKLNFEYLKNIKNSNDRSGYLIYMSNKKVSLT